MIIGYLLLNQFRQYDIDFNPQHRHTLGQTFTVLIARNLFFFFIIFYDFINCSDNYLSCWRQKCYRKQIIAQKIQKIKRNKQRYRIRVLLRCVYSCRIAAADIQP